MVQPDQTTAYKLVAANENGRSEKTVTVEVRGLPVIHHFTCLPCQVRAGEAATLSWDLSGGARPGAGVYFLRMLAGDRVIGTRRLVVLM